MFTEKKIGDTRVEKLGTRIAVGKEKTWKVGEVHPISYEARFRDFTENEVKPFGAHRYVTLNGDRKAIELQGIYLGATVFYAFKEEENLVTVIGVVTGE